MVDAFENLATAMASERASIAKLTATISRLTTELAMVNKNPIVDLRTICAICRSRGGHSRADRGHKYGDGTPTLADTEGIVGMEPPIHYFWTYGHGCRHNFDK